MDPEARVVVTAHDATAAAFRSADRNLKSFARGAMQVRSVLAGLGVALSGRALASWMSRAVETTEAVGDQRVVVEQARAAFDSFRVASDSLAESFAIRATPAVIAFGEALDAIRKFTAPTDQDILTGRIEDAKRELAALQQSINAPFRDLYQSDEAKAAQDARLRQLKETIQVLEAAQLASDQALFTRLPEITPAETKALEDFITALNLPKNIASKEEWDALESAIYAMNQREPFITQDEIIALEEFINELNAVAPSLTQEEWIDLESFIHDLNTMEQEAARTAESMGMDFRHSFAGWLKGADLGFKELLRQMAIDMAVSGIFDAFASMFSGSTSGFGKFMSSFFGGARAEGGPVSAGRGYLVGERGPELFVPGMSGAIVPNGGGSVVIHQTNTFNGGDPRELSAAIAANNARLKNEIKSEILYRQRRGQWG